MKKAHIIFFYSLFIFFSVFNIADAAWYEQTGAGLRSWRDLDFSKDGNVIFGAAYNGKIVKSANSGISWTELNSAGIRYWNSIAISFDAQKILSGGELINLFTSSDSGLNWSERTGSGSRDWNNVASSADGVKIVASVYGGGVYTSSDSGVNWTNQTNAGSRNWRSLAISNDGSKIVAGSYGGRIYTSSDSGGTWNEIVGAGSRNWRSIAVSGDGNNIVAVVNGGNIFTSNDFGLNWTTQTSAGSRNWIAVDTSDDFETIIAAVDGGGVYVSNDSGENWTVQTSLGTKGWTSVTVSEDAEKMAASAWAGYVYIFDESEPVIYDGNPDSSLPPNTAETELSVMTNENANCKYSLIPDTSYLEMENSFSSTGDLEHTTNITGLVSDTEYIFYIKCEDLFGNENLEDYQITFDVIENVPPIISNGLPVGEQPSNLKSTEISFQTNENSTCKYSLSPDVEYDDMEEVFSETGGINHSVLISNLAPKQTYNFHIRCEDVNGNKNDEDYLINFNIKKSGGVFSSGINATCSVSNRQPRVGEVVEFKVKVRSDKLDIEKYKFYWTKVLSGENLIEKYKFDNIGIFNPKAKIDTSKDSISVDCGRINVINSEVLNKSNNQSDASNDLVVEPVYVFFNDLNFGMRNFEVKKLQEFLNKNNFTVAESGPGSPGNETDLFGNATKMAVVKFQLSRNISPALGFFGPITRGFANSI